MNFPNVMEQLKEIEGKDFEQLKAKQFSDYICERFFHIFKVEKEVVVNDRGDGRKGKVDLVVHTYGKKIGIELDRQSPRKKSIFKLKQLNADERYVILRSPVKIIKID